MVTFAPDKVDFKEICDKYHANIGAIAQHYGVSKQTVYQLFKRDTECKKIIDEARENDKENMLDMAEFVVVFNMQNYKNNPAMALRAAEKVLDKLGHRRGWGISKDELLNDDRKQAFDKFMEEFGNMRLQSISSMANNIYSMD